MAEGETTGLPGDETEDTVQRWGYETRFKYYLYRIGILGNEGVESIHNFPAQIELNDKWHTALNRLKAESRDGIERWAPVGMNESRDMDFIPATTIKGYHTEAEALTTEEVRRKYGVVHNIGDTHTHPSDWFNSLGLNLITASRLVKDLQGFSPHDLYIMVDGYGLPMTAVVEKDHNYFAFRTAETRDLPPDSHLRPASAFSRHWARKYGGYYLGKSDIAFWASPKFSLAKLNEGIAEEYQLALYQGKPGHDLVREYP